MPKSRSRKIRKKTSKGKPRPRDQVHGSGPQKPDAPAAGTGATKGVTTTGTGHSEPRKRRSWLRILVEWAVGR